MLVGRRAVWAGGDDAGLRVAGADGLAASGAAPPCGGPLGSALMMLTGGIEADDGKNNPLPGAALACGADAPG